MHSVELLEQALEIAKKLGYQVREECVGGNGGGSCVVRGQKSLFLDPMLDIPDRLELVCPASRSHSPVSSPRTQPTTQPETIQTRTTPNT